MRYASRERNLTGFRKGTHAVSMQLPLLYSLKLNRPLNTHFVPVYQPPTAFHLRSFVLPNRIIKVVGE